MKKETFLPMFPGFYDSIYEPDESMEIESINEQRTEPVDFDDIVFDYQDYYEQVGRKVCDYIEDKLVELGLPCKITFKEIDSPKHYNFTNDKIVADIQCDFRQLRKLFLADERLAQQVLNENHKSRSEFISFYPCDLETWKNLKMSDVDHNHLCTMLEVILSSDFEEYDMYERVMSDVFLSATNYEELIK